MSDGMDLIVRLGRIVQERDALKSEVESLSGLLAMREVQVGFSEACAAHGTNYSDTCGGCSVSRRVATYCPSPGEDAG